MRESTVLRALALALLFLAVNSRLVGTPNGDTPARPLALAVESQSPVGGRVNVRTIFHHKKPPNLQSQEHLAGDWFRSRGLLTIACRISVMAALATVGVMVGLWTCGKRKNAAQWASALPITHPSDAQEGDWVKVCGTVAVVEGEQPLRSVLEGRACVYTEALAETAAVKQPCFTVARHEAATDFVILPEIGEGTVFIRATDVHVHQPRRFLQSVYLRKLMPPDFEDFVRVYPTPGHCGEHSLAQPSLRFEESVLEVGARVTLVGVAVRQPGTRQLCLVPDTVAHLEAGSVPPAKRSLFRKQLERLVNAVDAHLVASHVMVFDDPIPVK